MKQDKPKKRFYCKRCKRFYNSISYRTSKTGRYSIYCRCGHRAGEFIEKNKYKICVYCNKKFIPSRKSSQKFCSSKCRWNNYQSKK